MSVKDRPRIGLGTVGSVYMLPISCLYPLYMLCFSFPTVVSCDVVSPDRMSVLSPRVPSQLYSQKARRDFTNHFLFNALQKVTATRFAEVSGSHPMRQCSSITSNYVPNIGLSARERVLISQLEYRRKGYAEEPPLVVLSATSAITPTP